jgi:small GTP-binding protein
MTDKGDDELMRNIDNIEIYKIIMIGDSGTGKTSLINKYVLNKFMENESNTIGVSYLTKKMLNPETKNLAKLCIWDTAGQDRFFSVVNMYFKFARGICCVYDITNTQSLLNCEKWIEVSLESLSGVVSYSEVPIYLIGNKHDLNEEITLESYEENHRQIFDKLKIQYNVKHYFSSAKTGENLHKIMSSLVLNMEPNIVKNEFSESYRRTNKNGNITLGLNSQKCNCY